MTAATNHPARVAVAMSGGVDSSVAAALLAQAGCEVIGLTMRLYDHDSAKLPFGQARGCCSLDAVHRARAVCHTLKIPHYTVDLRSDFEQCVIEDFVAEYLAGRTPNPCVRCNTYLKWGALYDKASVLGCDAVATGHYARIETGDDGCRLRRAADPSKDQSYALWGIPRDRLAHTRFPLGGLTKPQVREIAANLGLKTAATPESQEICFVPDDDYAAFLERRCPDAAALLASGDLIEETDSRRRPVGRHGGCLRYTVGQRRGLGGGFDQPRYVLRVEPNGNRVVMGRREQLRERAFDVDQVNWLIPPPDMPLRADVQIRYRSAASQGTITPLGDAVRVDLDEPAEAVAPGQSAVFYQGDRVIGGGRIISVIRRTAGAPAIVGAAGEEES